MFGKSLGRLHAKTAAIDKTRIFIGSMNLDPRSASQNTEMGLAGRQPAAGARDDARHQHQQAARTPTGVRLAKDTGTLQWLTNDGEKEVILTSEPESSFFQRFYNMLRRRSFPRCCCSLRGIAQTFTSLSAPQVMLWGVLFFGGIDLGFGGITWLLTKRAAGAGHRARTRSAAAAAGAMLRRELGQSGVSVLIFGLGMVFPWGLLQLGWARLDGDAGWRQIAVEILVLAFWNDVHFWINHRLLHTRWLRRFHGPHHRSFVTTPGDAALAPSRRGADARQRDPAADGGTRLQLLVAGGGAGVPQPVLQPPSGIRTTTSSRACCTATGSRQAAAGTICARHAAHNGNYGFQFTFMDRLFRTRLRPMQPSRCFGFPEEAWRDRGLTRAVACRGCATGATGRALPTSPPCLRWRRGNGSTVSTRCCMG